MKHPILFVVLCLLLTTACNDLQTTSSPTPTRSVVSIALSTGTVSVGRNESTQVSATATWSDGTTADVTASAAWTSSNSQVATVAAGLVTAVGLGDAQVAATYGGKITTADVVVHRNTRIQGKVTIADSLGQRHMNDIAAYLDGVMVGAYGTSASYASLTVSFPYSGANSNVEPGTHELAVGVRFSVEFPGVASISGLDSYYQIVDTDTNEVLATFLLPQQTRLLPAGTYMTWPLEIGTYQ